MGVSSQCYCGFLSFFFCFTNNFAIACIHQRIQLFGNNRLQALFTFKSE